MGASSLIWLGAPNPERPSIAKLPGIESVPCSGLRALWQTSEALRVPVDALAAVICIETRFDPKAISASCLKRTGDPGKCPAGLIQFLPSTAVVLGTTASAIRSMTFAGQMRYVLKFYEMNKCEGAQDVGELYVCTFCPKVRGAEDSTVLGREDDDSKGPCGKYSSIYTQNSGFDRNKSGQFTVGDVRDFARDMLALGQSKGRVEVPFSCPTKPKKLPWLAAGAAVAVGVITFPYWRGAVGV